MTIFYAEDDLSYLIKYKDIYLKHMSIEIYEEMKLNLEVYILYKRIYNINVKEEI